jgi:putative phosphoribosyl transferase
MHPQRFRDRREAGRLLAKRLAQYKGRTDVLVLALPRGGVPVAHEITAELHAPMDVFVVRKLGVPWQPELAMGAIASDGVEVLNGDVVTACRIPPRVIREVAEREASELRRRLLQYRGDRPLPVISGRTVILVDDGLATGSTMRAAVMAVRHEQPAAVIVAVPVGAASTCAELRSEVDEIVCLHSPPDFSAVGLWYDDFSPTSDEEVRRLLAAHPAPQPAVRP